MYVKRLPSQPNPVVVVDLMWSDVEEDSSGEVIGLEGKYISVAKSVISLHQPENGIHSYTPILFDDTHFVQVDCIIHSCMHTVNFLPRSASQVVRASASKSVIDDFDDDIPF